MPQRRRYTKPQKLAAVMAAEMGGVTEAGRQTGIPKETIQYWLTRPEFAQFRTKAREDMAEEIKVVAHLAWQRTAEALRDGSMEPRDVLFAAEKATNLQLLMSGEVTSRAETVSPSLPPEVQRALRERFAEVARSAAGDPGDGVETPSEAAPATT
jgi:transposase-like protein